MDDTHPQIDRVRIQMLRDAGLARRAHLANRLSREARWRAMQAVTREHPSLSPIELRLLLLELNHGRDLADRVRRFLNKAPRGR